MKLGTASDINITGHYDPTSLCGLDLEKSQVKQVELSLHCTIGSIVQQ
jgi:hypothetical protein